MRFCIAPSVVHVHVNICCLLVLEFQGTMDYPSLYSANREDYQLHKPENNTMKGNNSYPKKIACTGLITLKDNNFQKMLIIS